MGLSPTGVDVALDVAGVEDRDRLPAGILRPGRAGSGQEIGGEDDDQGQQNGQGADPTDGGETVIVHLEAFRQI
jgi:hypothetical protein